MERILITGANRGIGLELARQYMQQGDVRAFAAARKPDNAHELKRLAASHAGHLFPLTLDVTDPQSIRLAAETVGNHADALDVIINNAGIKPPAQAESFAEITPETMLKVCIFARSIADFELARRRCRLGLFQTWPTGQQHAQADRGNLSRTARFHRAIGHPAL